MSESANEHQPHGDNATSQVPKPSGIRPPSSISSLPKVTRICTNHEKKPDLPIAATPKKQSEYKTLLFLCVTTRCVSLDRLKIYLKTDN